MIFSSPEIHFLWQFIEYNPFFGPNFLILLSTFHCTPFKSKHWFMEDLFFTFSRSSFFFFFYFTSFETQLFTFVLCMLFNLPYRSPVVLCQVWHATSQPSGPNSLALACLPCIFTWPQDSEFFFSVNLAILGYESPLNPSTRFFSLLQTIRWIILVKLSWCDIYAI